MSSLETLNQLSARITTLVKDESLTNVNLTTTEESKLFHDLERRNQELAGALNNEKLTNDELSVKIRDLNSNIDRLNIEIDRLKVDGSMKLTKEMGPLHEQLQSHIQTIGILVGEKAELQAYLKEYQNVMQEKRSENEELQARLRASRFRVSELERENKVLKDTSQFSGNSGSNRLTKPDELAETFNKVTMLAQENEELHEEVQELKQKINLKNEEINTLRSDVDKKMSDINMAHLRIEQLSAGDSLMSDSRIESLTQQNLEKERQINELKNMIEQLSNDRDQTNAQYQSYVLQLNREVSQLGDKILNLTEENSKLTKRESDLVKHVGDLERQIQQHINMQKNSEEIVSVINNTEIDKKLIEAEAKVTELTDTLYKTRFELEQTKVIIFFTNKNEMF